MKWSPGCMQLFCKSWDMHCWWKHKSAGLQREGRFDLTRSFDLWRGGTGAANVQQQLENFLSTGGRASVCVGMTYAATIQEMRPTQTEEHIESEEIGEDGCRVMVQRAVEAIADLRRLVVSCGLNKDCFICLDNLEKSMCDGSTKLKEATLFSF